MVPVGVPPVGVVLPEGVSLPVGVPPVGVVVPVGVAALGVADVRVLALGVAEP
tara:strand:- start:14 stop:172 length:159 start_codon:yes stop_codon:yes gene_type:complete